MSTAIAACRPAALVLSALAMMAATSQPTIDSLHPKRRVLILSAPNASDPSLAKQQKILATWRKEAADRDLSTVEVLGDEVRGVSNPAASLRSRYRISAAVFEAVLIGKDGNVAKRSTYPIAATDLQAIIDAMPMRRAGER